MGCNKLRGKSWEERSSCFLFPIFALSYCLPELVLAEMKFSVKVAAYVGKKKLWKKV
jgi:hypothetical protein